MMFESIIIIIIYYATIKYTLNAMVLKTKNIYTTVIFTVFRTATACQQQYTCYYPLKPEIQSQLKSAQPPYMYLKYVFSVCLYNYLYSIVMINEQIHIVIPLTNAKIDPLRLFIVP